MANKRVDRIVFITVILIFSSFFVSAAPKSNYMLPYMFGKEFKCTQGNYIKDKSGLTSHYLSGASWNHHFAFDFLLSDGEAVRASRGGKVLFVRNDSTMGCGDFSCANLANYVVIDHGDGTSALYYHLKYDSISPKEGDTVKVNDIIAKADSTGWITGAHLHFQVEKTPSSINNVITDSIETSFADDDVCTQEKDCIPKEGKTYRAGIMPKITEDMPQKPDNRNFWEKTTDFFKGFVNFFQGGQNSKYNQATISPLVNQENNSPNESPKTDNSVPTAKSDLQEAVFKAFASACDRTASGSLKYSSDVWKFTNSSNQDEFVDGTFTNKNGCKVDVWLGSMGSFCGLGDSKAASCSEQFDQLTINGNTVSRNFATKGSEFMAGYDLHNDDKSCCNEAGCGHEFDFSLEASSADIGKKCMADFEELLKTFELKSSSQPIPAAPEQAKIQEKTSPKKDSVIGTYNGVLTDILIYGNYAFGLGDGVEVINISNPQKPVKVGSIPTRKNVNAIALSGNYLYLAEDFGMEIFDVKTPTDAKLVGSWGDTFMAGNMGIQVADNRAYICDGVVGGLKILDVTDASTPKKLASPKPDVACDGNNFFVIGKYGYGNSGGRSGFKIFDLSDSQKPQEISSYTENPDSISNITISGNVAYVGYDDKVEILDITDRKLIKKIGECKDFCSKSTSTRVIGNYFYLARGFNGLSIVDISDNKNPKLVLSFKDANPNAFAVHFAVKGNYVYIASELSNMVVVDTTK